MRSQIDIGVSVLFVRRVVGADGCHGELLGLTQVVSVPVRRVHTLTVRPSSRTNTLTARANHRATVTRPTELFTELHCNETVIK